jgi:predicted acetyltransferase
MEPDQDVVLRNLFEYYVHDMAEWFEIDTKADGSYSYDTSSVWNNGCEAWLAKLGDSIAGFAVIGPAVKWSDPIPAFDVHEFFVIRRYRRHGLGAAMSTRLWDAHPGEWLVRVVEANAVATRFWRTSIATYSSGAYVEQVRIVNNRRWIFFRFTSGPSR